MAELPILPLKVQRLLADTTHMTSEQFGAYCRILFTMWTQGGYLPDTEGELARISGLSLRRWRTVSEPVRRPFTTSNGTISQKRLSETRLEVQEIRAKRAAAAEKRWRGAGAMQMHSTSIAIQNQTKSLSSLSRGTPITAKQLMERPDPQLALPVGPVAVKKRGQP